MMSDNIARNMLSGNCSSHSAMAAAGNDKHE